MLTLRLQVGDAARIERHGIHISPICIALVVYEHLVTLRFEKELLWRRNWSAATWIFVFNRYLLLADVLFLIVPFGSQASALIYLSVSI